MCNFICLREGGDLIIAEMEMICKFYDNTTMSPNELHEYLNLVAYILSLAEDYYDQLKMHLLSIWQLCESALAKPLKANSVLVIIEILEDLKEIYNVQEAEDQSLTFKQSMESTDILYHLQNIDSSTNKALSNAVDSFIDGLTEDEIDSLIDSH